MKHPCKKCLVKAVCQPSIPCKEWNSYSNVASQLITAISVITGSLGLGLLLVYLETTFTNGPGDYAMLVVIVWIISILINTCIDESLRVNCGFFMKWCLAPVLTWFYIILFSTQKYFKRA